MHDSISVSILNSEGTVFEGEAKALSSTNEMGPFDVLPLHSNFISIIKDKVVVHLKSGENKEFKIDSGILKAAENKLQVFLGIEAFTQEQNLSA
jgi:F0F1-type ATP synthase epsilon subunit